MCGVHQARSRSISSTNATVTATNDDLDLRHEGRDMSSPRMGGSSGVVAPVNGDHSS